MKSSIIVFVVGMLSGLVAAICGVGGGIVMVPAFRGILEIDQKQAVATSLAVIIPTALIATWRNSSGNEPLVDWRLVIPAALGAVIAAYFASGWMRSISNASLTRIFAILLILTGFKMLFTKP